MSYTKQNFRDGQTLTHDHLNHIEEGIVALEASISAGGTTSSGSTSTYWKGKKMVWDGDSISYGSWLSNPTSEAYPYQVANALGMSVYNFAIGGAYAAKPKGSFDKYYWDYSQWQSDVANGVVDTSKKYLVKNSPGAAKPCKIYYYNGSSWVTDSSTGGWAVVERMKEMVAKHPDADVVGIAIGTNDFYTAACQFGEVNGANYRNLEEMKNGASSSYETVEQVSTLNLVDDLIAIDDYAELTAEFASTIESTDKGVALMVPVKAGTKYYSSNATWCWYYTDSQEAISPEDVSTTEGYTTAPAGAAFLSLTFPMANLENETAELYEVVMVSTDNRENLLDKAIFKDNCTLSSSSYSFTNNEQYYVYDCIPIEGGKRYETSFGYRSWFLDKDKKSISTVNLSAQEFQFTAPVNAAYISIAFYKTKLPNHEDAYVKSLDAAISEAEEELTKSTFCGAIHTICKYLLENYKNKDIFFVTPIKRYQPGSWDCKYPEDKNKLGYSLKDYVDAIIEICGYYSIPVIDLYSLSGLNPHIDRSLFGDTDAKAVHPNLAGHQRMASIVVAQMQSLRK